MRNVLLSILILSSMPVLANGVGNGGDQIRFLFNEGRKDAIDRISSIKRCSFQDAVSNDVKDWILKMKSLLVSDIASSPHSWITDNQATCAHTMTTKNYPITLSFVACKNITNKALAGRLLTHETVHHFGISDESMADAVAIAIYTANDNKSCPDPTDDPFDPMSCVGDPADLNQLAKYFKVTQTRALLSGFASYARQRKCHSITGCSDWSKTSLYASNSFSVGNQTYHYTLGVNQGGSIYLNLQADSIYLDLDFGSSTICEDPFNGSNLNSPCRGMKGPSKLNPKLGAVNPDSPRINTNSSIRYNWSPLAPGISGALTGDLNVTFDQGVFTDHCLRLSNSSIASGKDDKGFWIERQGIIYSKY